MCLNKQTGRPDSVLALSGSSKRRRRRNGNNPSSFGPLSATLNRRQVVRGETSPDGCTTHTGSCRAGERTESVSDGRNGQGVSGVGEAAPLWGNLVTDV